MPITNDDGQPLSSADLLALHDLMQPTCWRDFFDDLPEHQRQADPSQLRGVLAEPIPAGDLEFWRRWQDTTPRTSSTPAPWNDLGDGE